MLGFWMAVTIGVLGLVVWGAGKVAGRFRAGLLIGFLFGVSWGLLLAVAVAWV